MYLDFNLIKVDENQGVTKAIKEFNCNRPKTGQQAKIFTDRTILTTQLIQCRHTVCATLFPRQYINFYLFFYKSRGHFEFQILPPELQPPCEDTFFFQPFQTQSYFLIHLVIYVILHNLIWRWVCLDVLGGRLYDFINTLTNRPTFIDVVTLCDDPLSAPGW